MNRLLDDNRLRYLFEAVRLGSVRAAADGLDVNPSVVSRQIGQLEKDLGVKLIERLSRGVRATEAGELLVQRFGQWSVDRNDTIAKLREIQGLQRGHIDIVLGEGFVSDLMSGPLNRFWQRHPRLTMSLDLAGTNEVVRAVAEDRSHIGLVYNARPDPRIRTAIAIRQPICLIARPDHSLSRRSRPVQLRELVGQAIGLMHPNYGTRQIVAMAEASEKIGLSPKLTTSSINVLRHFVKADMGVTLLPAFSITADIADGTLVALPVDNPLLASTETQVITRLGRELPNAANQLLRFLISQMRAFHETSMPVRSIRD
jgi:DNA-binding transcriptional LysR family regulator